MIDFIDKDEQLKVEDPDWHTYWDDESHCWMMAELVKRRCLECDGTGTIQVDDDDPWSMEDCIACHGTGKEIVDIRWDDAIPCEDYLSLIRQRNYLRNRYGTIRPKSIRDYWLAS